MKVDELITIGKPSDLSTSTSDWSTLDHASSTATFWLVGDVIDNEIQINFIPCRLAGIFGNDYYPRFLVYFGSFV